MSEFTPHALEVTKVKASHLASPSAVHQYEPGFIEPGDAAGIINFKKADYATLHGHTIARQKRNYRIRVNDGSTPTNGSNTVFQGFMQKLGKEQFTTDATNPVRAAFTVAVDGLPVFTQGS